jgi:putative acetyltransferase
MKDKEFRIRRYRGGDAEALTKLYRESVLEIGKEQYTREQVEVWASYADELEEIRHSLADGITLVAEAGGRPVGFGQLNPVSHVSFLYTSKEYPRTGVARAIYKRLEEFAVSQNVTKLDTRASRISRSFFEKMGFQLVSPVVDTRKGIEIECFIMEKGII